MAQHDYSIANGTGSAVRSDLNNALAAIVSMNSGSTEPSTTFAFQFWADTNANLLKMRNSANDGWIELRQLDGEFTNVSVANGTAAAPSIFFNASGTDTGIYSNGTDSVDVSTGGTRRLDIGSGGDVTVRGGNVTLNAQGDLRLADSDSSNWVAFQAPATVASNVTWTLPSTDGTNGQSLTTNGSGTLSWTSAGGASITQGNTRAEVVDTGSDGHFKVVTEGTEALRVDASRRLLVGTANARSNVELYNTNRTPTLQVETVTNTNNNGIALINNNGSGWEPMLTLGTSGGASIGSNTLVGNGTAVGSIAFSGNDGDQFVELARITGFVDGTPGADDMPGRLSFLTTADGASTPTERMRIESTGSVVCAGDIFTGTSGALLTDTIHSRATTNDDSTSRIQFRPRNAAGGSSVQAEITVSGLFKFNSGYGSAATAYGCRAWVNFNGGGTLSIRNHGNISSVTDLGTGEYRINFSNSMPDTNYAAVCGSSIQFDSSTMTLYANRWSGSAPAISNTGYIECSSRESSQNQVKDINYGYLAVFR